MKKSIRNLCLVLMAFCCVFLISSIGDAQVASAASYTTTSADTDLKTDYRVYDGGTYYYDVSVKLSSGQKVNTTSNNGEYAFGGSTINFSWQRTNHNTGIGSWSGNGHDCDTYIRLMFRLFRDDTALSQSYKYEVWESSDSTKFSECNDVSTNKTPSGSFSWSGLSAGVYSLKLDPYGTRSQGDGKYTTDGDEFVVAKFYVLDSNGPTISVKENSSSQKLPTYNNKFFSKASSIYISAIDDMGPIKSLKLNNSDIANNTMHELEVGINTIWAEDYSNNSRSVNVIYDNTAPQVKVNNSNKTELTTYTNTSFTVSASDTYYQALYYKFVGDTQYKSTMSTSITVTVGKEDHSKDGVYQFYAVDIAGNASNIYTVKLDTVAPTLKGIVDGGKYQNTVTIRWDDSVKFDAGDSISAKYSKSATNKYPTTSTTSFSSGQQFKDKDEGNYRVELKDSAGNTKVYQFIIDKTAPTVSELPEYVNHTFTYSATDVHTVVIHYVFDGAEKECTNGSFTVECVEKNYGEWKFWAVDECGNKSETQTVKLFHRDDFGNLENIKNGYKVSTWYTVTLPAKVYTTIAGSYSFRTQADALDFAIAKEWEYRVEKLTNGWSYVNISNENVSQIYTSKSDLDTAILKYASSYVSDRKEMRLGNNSYPNPTENGEIKADALTFQNLVCPGMLLAYKGYPLYFIRHDYQFAQPTVGVAGNTRKAQIKYLATDFKTVSSSPITIDYGIAIEKLLTAKGAYKQGYYLVEESDLCGNYQSYIVYLDIDMPTLSAVATDYGGEQSTIEFTNEYVTLNSGVMLYVTLELKSILDNIDDCVMLCISGRGMDNKIFVAEDELPTLGLQYGYYGSYKISVYDRSLNDLTFNIRIAGEEPYLTYTSLTNETRCTFTINYDSFNNGITDVHIFKVSYLGEYTEIHEDSNGTPISAATLQYVIRTGGKYVVRFTDIFGRVIESEPLFYMKGLPIGTLKGVKDGGITNRDVSFEYSDDSSIYLYAYIDKAWVRYDEVLTFVEKEGYTIASIAANADTSLIYKFFLYVSSDMNLFTEYRFEVDCIAPTAVAATVDGVEVSPETVTTSAFSVNWDEANVTARYYNTKDALGQLAESVYQKNTVITRAGTYIFTVRDVVGNETVFSITLDNMVSYSIDGKYSILEDGSYISKTDLILTVTEHTSKFECTASNGAAITNGATLTEDGTYVFEIRDAFGNTLELTIIIDKLPPMPVILTQSNQVLEIDGSTNESFTVSCEELGVKTTIKNGNQYQSYSGEALSEEGTYSFKMVDRMGNTITFTVTIDSSVDYRVNGTYLMLEDGSYISRLSLSISMREDYKSFTVTSSGSASFLPNEKIDVEGVYEVTIVDSVGNVAVVKFIIDKTPPTPTIIADDGSEVLHGKTNQPFIVTCAEPGSALRIATTASSNGSIYLGEQLSEKGVYYFRLTDLIGNELVFSVEIDLNVGFNVKGTYKIDKNGAYISSSSLSIEITEEYSSFVVSVFDTDLSILPGEAITQEGTYFVRIVDIAGNVQEICLIIDKTAPSFIITSISGVTVEPNQIIKEGFVVRCDEEGAVIKVSRTGTKYAVYDGDYCTIDNVYYFIVQDFIGNEIEFSVEIDLAIDFIVRGNFIQDGNRYSSRTALAVEVREDIMSFDVQSSNGVSFNEGEQINVEGIYLVSITDFAGNTLIIEIIIDKTAPTPRVSATSGSMIAPNSTTRFPFVILGDEGDTITYSTSNVAKYELYDGAVLSEEKKYFFIMTDYVGNETSFYITLDMSVAYALKGTYIIDDDGIVFSRSGISVQISEPYETFTVNGAVNQSVIAGERITAEGEYFIQLEDAYGNTAALTIVIVMTAPKIVASVESGAASRESVYVSIEGATQAYYRNQSGDVINIDSSCVLSENGDYTIVAKDLVGNESIYKFTIDTFVEVDIKPLIVSGQIVTEPMTFKFNENVKSTLWFNGVETVYSSRISEHGEYRLRAEDELGNVFDIEWTILEPIANFYEFDIPDGFEARLLSDETFAPVQGAVKLDKDGEYMIEFSHEDYSYTIVLTVDTVAPTVEITQKKNQISFSKADKDNVTYTLYLNGNEIKGSPNSTITECGKYTLVVTDELGNQSTYTFELNYINTFGIVVIVIGCVVLLAIIIGVLVYRGRLSVK